MLQHSCIFWETEKFRIRDLQRKVKTEATNEHILIGMVYRLEARQRVKGGVLGKYNTKTGCDISSHSDG